MSARVEVPRGWVPRWLTLALGAAAVAAVGYVSLRSTFADDGPVALAYDTTSAEPGCEPTIPQGNFVPEDAGAGSPMGASNARWFGSNDLWTAVPADGRIGTGRLDDKSFWWSTHFDLSREPRPALTVTARRLDGPGDAASGLTTHGWLDDGKSFMLTGLALSDYGCWRVRGEYKGYVLEYVVEVVPN